MKAAGIPNSCQPRRTSPVLVERINREKLDSTHAEIAANRNLLDQARESSALARRDARTWMPRETADVHFIDDCLGEWSPDGVSPSQS